MRALKHVVRRLWRAPGFTAIALVTLALGIGANTAIFSVLNGVLMKPLPYPRAQELVGVWHVAPGIAGIKGDINCSPPMYLTYGLLQALNVRPVAGRWFSQADDAPGAPETVMLTYGYWQRRFGGNPSAIGRALTVRKFFMSPVPWLPVPITPMVMRLEAEGRS